LTAGGPIRVLVVDDSALVRKLLFQVLTAQPDFEVALARSGAEALDLMASFRPDVVTLDFHMPQMDGLACLDRIMLERPCPVVMVSSATPGGAELTLEALRLGAVDFVAKPAGALSIRIDDLAVELVAKVRAAAAAKVRLTSRLRDRVRHRLGSAAAGAGQPRGSARDTGGYAAGNGEGLVVVGTSTGGPPALEALLTPLAPDFPWPIVIAQHMPRGFTGALARRLDSLCAIHVVEVDAPATLEPGFAYIGIGEADVVLTRRGGRLAALAAPPDPHYPWRPSTDRLVRTAMKQLSSDRIVGVLMTGMGDDGARAMTDLRAGGGRTIAEAESTAVVWGMPGELVRAGGATVVAPLDDIAARLSGMVR
jgi:two-component system chemotaxis response regulator CheB